MRQLTSIVVSWSVAVAVTFALVEIALRALPGVIPLGLLKHFEPGVRLGIAQRRGLPNESQVWVLSRDDGGPELKLFKPFSRVEMRFRDRDAVDVMELDANGFCNPLPDGGYAAPKIDIVTIGDSFTWCQALGPEATWTSQLSKRVGRPAYNLGRGGIGPYEYVQILKRFGLQKSPDIVVMNIYEGNDLRDAVRYWGSADPARRGDAAPLDRRARAPAGNAVSRHSYAYNLVSVALVKASVAATKGIDRLRGVAGPQDVDFRYSIQVADGEVRFNAANADTDEVAFAAAVVDGRVDPAVLDTALRSFTDLGRRHSFRPVVAYSPSAHTAYAHSVAFSDPALAELMARYSRALRAHLARAAGEMGFLFVDATPALQAASAASRRDDLLYFPTNVHYTTAGHRVLAETLAGALAAAPAR